LIVEYILLIPNSAGAWTHQAQLPSPTKPNDDFRLVVKFIPILIFDGAQAPSSMLIVRCNYSKISLHFCKDFRIFCKGEWEVKDKRSANSNYSVTGFQLVVKSILISNSEGARFAPNITVSIKAASTFFDIKFKLIVKSASDALHFEGARTVPKISSIESYGPSSHNGLVNFMGFGLVGLIGLGRVSLIGQISFVGQISLVKLISHIIGHNCLDGVIRLGLVSLVDLVSLSGINDLVGLDSLFAAIIAAAEFLVVMAKQAAAAKTHGDAIKLASTTKVQLF
jgi:hypothetical protein